jgi:membrane protein DedA with SNARE-associated domain
MIETLSTLPAAWAFALVMASLTIGRCGLPLPSTVLMLATGALVISSPSQLALAIALAYGAALLGDIAAYPLGKYGGAWIEARAGKSAKIARLIRQAEDLARNWGALAVLITRWPLSTIGPYVNLMAGALGLSYPRYLAWCAVGELIWVSVYLSLGYVFAANLDRVIEASGQGALLVLGLAGLCLGAMVLWRRRAMAPPGK